MNTSNSDYFRLLKQLKKRVESVVIALDEAAIRWHLRRTESRLRATDVKSLGAAAQEARARTLDELNDYWKNYDLPRNDQNAQRVPTFIDAEGRACAVAHLVMASGYAELARHVANVANTAYVPEMKFRELAQWAQSNGVTVEELARIQPGYPPTDPVRFAELLTAASRFALPGLAISGIGAITLLVNIVQMVRKRIGRLAVFVGIAVGTASLVVSLLMAGLVTQMSALFFESPLVGGLEYTDFIFIFVTASIFFIVGILAIVTGTLRLFVNMRLKRRSQNDADAPAASPPS